MAFTDLLPASFHGMGRIAKEKVIAKTPRTGLVTGLVTTAGGHLHGGIDPFNTKLFYTFTFQRNNGQEARSPPSVATDSQSTTMVSAASSAHVSSTSRMGRSCPAVARAPPSAIRQPGAARSARGPRLLPGELLHGPRARRADYRAGREAAGHAGRHAHRHGRACASGGAALDRFDGLHYRGGPGDVTGFYLRYQGELLGLWDPQNRDPRRKPTPETKFSVVLLSPPLGGGVLISGHNI